MPFKQVWSHRVLIESTPTQPDEVGHPTASAASAESSGEPDLEVLEVIVEECLELVIEGRVALQALSRGGGGDTRQHTDALFRVLHTIKGNAGFAQLSNIAAAVHAAESVLAAMRDGSLEFTADRAYLLTETLDETELALSLVLDVYDDKAFLPEARALCELLAAECEKAGPEYAPSAPPPPPQALRVAEARAQTTRTMRVLTDRVDSLAEDALRLEQLHRDLVDARQVGALSPEQLHELGALAARMRASIHSLSEVPVRPMFQKMRRLVRSLGPELGKRVEVSVSGDHHQLDVRLLSPLSDCLMHLLRNCVAHGIERPRTRSAIGKSPVGLVRMALEVDPKEVRMRVEDDGAGIDRRAVLRRAIQQGLVERDPTELSDNEILRLVMHPGLSTAASVSQVAGRGVGMDAVLTRIKSLGGHFDVASQVNEGTRFLLRIPNLASAAS